jgi:hypothetical protein
MQHEPLAAANIQDGALGRQLIMLLKIRDDRLPKTRLILKTAVTETPVAVKIFPAELAPDAPVLLCLLLGTVLQIPFGLRIMN